MDTLAASARASKLVVFAGAGVSMAPPSSLPNWWAINEAVLAALARRITVFTDAEFSANVLKQLVATRNENNGFAPDYQAQIIEDECGLEYFKVLQALDTPDINANHVAVARLAAAGHLAAIVTTNFDRLIEHALDAQGVRHRVFAAHAHFQELPAFIETPTAAELPVIKVHGSVEAPESMVDTLRQRLMGRPETLEQSLRALLARHHVLFAGFSGADLAYDPGYLGLRAAADANRGFTALVRPNDVPNPAMAALREAWGAGAAFVHGDLPIWWNDLLADLELAPIDGVATGATATTRLAAVDAHADGWAESLGHMLSTAILAELLEATGRSELAFELLARTYKLWIPERDAEAPGYARFHYQLGRRLIELGQFDHRLDAQRAREAKQPDASPYTFTDCFQCIRRSMDGTFPDGDLALGLYDTLYGMPGNGAARIRAVRTAARQARRVGAFIDACRALAIPYEITQHYTDALEWLELAYQEAKAFGDEPRRAAVCAEQARFLAMKKREDEAHAKIDEGLTIAERLRLTATRIDLMAARGGIFVACDDAVEGVKWLDPAIEWLRKANRRPALLRALLDACYAASILGSQERFETAHDEMIALSERYPGYEPQMILVLARVHRIHGNVKVARDLFRDAQMSAAHHQNPAVADEARRLEASLPPDEAIEPV